MDSGNPFIVGIERVFKGSGKTALFYSILQSRKEMRSLLALLQCSNQYDALACSDHIY